MVSLPPTSCCSTPRDKGSRNFVSLSSLVLWSGKVTITLFMGQLRDDEGASCGRDLCIVSWPSS